MPRVDNCAILPLIIRFFHNVGYTQGTPSLRSAFLCQGMDLYHVGFVCQMLAVHVFQICRASLRVRGSDNGANMQYGMLETITLSQP